MVSEQLLIDKFEFNFSMFFELQKNKQTNKKTTLEGYKWTQYLLHLQNQ